ncbi:MAG TPA: glycosyltransferase family 4 protein, partial [Kofleriaceae bacterium]
KFDQPLRDSIRELGLTDQIEVLGPVDHDQLPALLATATVCVVPAAADLTPSPTVVFPTKILEYMACRRAIVAPRRETLAHIVENNREALLFEAGDPIDLARKVLRLLGDPLLRERLAGHAYDRVRRELTASAARRAIKNAYDRLSEKFADSFLEARDDESPKVELLADDDFEATVFEEAPAPPAVDTLGKPRKAQPLEEALQSLGAQDIHDAHASTSSSAVAVPRDDETMERIPVAPASSSNAWTVSALAAPPAPSPGQAHDDWVVTNVAQAVRAIDGHGDTDGDADDADGDVDDLDAELLIEEGTPIEGVSAVAPAPPVVETTFVAGEIDVPAPRPRRARDRDDLTPAVEFTAASAILGPIEIDPDTGSRTPPIERR